MAIVQLDMNEYRSMERRQESADKKIRSLIEEIKNNEEQNIKELEELKKKNSVLVIEKGVGGDFVSVVNFEDIRKDVEEHFKKGLFNNELTKLANDQFAAHIEENDSLKEKVSQLNAEILRLKNRSFFERLFNIWKTN